MRVYIWKPWVHFLRGNFVGHVAIEIENEYFSFNPNRKSNDSELWNTFEQDKNGFGKEADVVIDVNVDRIFHPYILDTFNPSYGYRGLGGRYYNLLQNNCCHVVGHFVSIGIFPYLVSLFGDSEKDSYWLKHEWINRGARLKKIESLYYKYNSDNFFDNCLSDLFYWQESEMYLKALYHMYGPVVSQMAAQKMGPTDAVYATFFNPGELIKYIKYAKAVVEDLSGRVPSIPWIFDYEQTDYGVSRKREIKPFKAQMIGIRGADLRFRRFTVGKVDFGDFQKEEE